MATITGTQFHDSLTGTSLNDTINGLSGADTMAGGLGNDTYIVDNLDDWVIEAVNGVDYGPFRNGQNPNTGVFPSLADLRADLPVLAGMTDAIRIFSVTHGFDAIPRLAEPFGIQVVATAFLNNEANSWAPAANALEIDALVALAGQHPANVPFVCIGSEAMETQGFSQQRLIDVINSTRARLPADVQMATAEPWDHFLATPNGTTPNALGAAVDVIYANIHPYWEGQPITNASVYVQQRYQQLKAAYPDKPVIISEVGWPTAGPDIGSAHPSLANQLKLLTDLPQGTLPFYAFEAFDEAWKGEPSGVEPHWGIFDSERQPKGTFMSFLSADPGGTDTVKASISYTLGASLENLTLTGSAAINGTGNADDNVITGNGAANTLDGRAGSDTVDSGAGDDRGLYRPSANVGDSDIYKGNLGTDTLCLELTHAELNSAAVQADLAAYQTFLRQNSNPASTSGSEFAFTAFGLKASTWEQLSLIDYEGMVWKNGGSVTIGTAASPTTVSIGTNSGLPGAGDLWVDHATTRNWSNGANWQDGSAPSAADTVRLDASDPFGTLTIDRASQVAALYDTGATGHVFELSGHPLAITGALAIGTANGQNTGALSLCDTNVVLHATSFNVGLNIASSSAVVGALFLNGRASMDASDTARVAIGRSENAWGGNASGTVVLAANSSLTVGTVDRPADLFVGHGLGGTVTGVLDARAAAATVELHLDEMNVGWSTAASAVGTLRWDQTEVIDANAVIFGRGKGGIGVLDVPAGGTLRLGTQSDPIAALRLGYDDFDTASASTPTRGEIDLTLTNPIFEANIGDVLDIGHKAVFFGPSTVFGSLTLGSRSKLTVGSVDHLADVLIGTNPGGNGGGISTGTFDASASGATVNLHLNELNVGWGGGAWTGTSAIGTLRWNQTEAIHANVVTFGRGKGGVGILDVPTGGTFRLGTANDPIGALRVGYDDRQFWEDGTTTTANLDFSLSNPVFQAYVEDLLLIGSKETIWGDTRVSGSLTLGSRSTLAVGDADNLADIIVGSSWGGTGNGGAVTGTLDALKGTLTAQLDQLVIGQPPGWGTAVGLVIMNAGDAVTAKTAYLGAGVGATAYLNLLGGTFRATAASLDSGVFDFNGNTLTIGAAGSIATQTFNLTGGLLTGKSVTVNGGTFNFSDGVLAIDTFTGILDQNGGVLDPGAGLGRTTVTGAFDLASAGTLRIPLLGNTAGSQYDQLKVIGTVNLNGDGGAGGSLDVDLGFVPAVNKIFTIVDNDGSDPIVGSFRGFAQGTTFNVAYGSMTVTMQISYTGGTGNDVTLTVRGVTGAAPAGLAISGTADADLLTGSVGNDTLNGGAGNDILTGSTGSDRFVFTVGLGSDRIIDFQRAVDKVELNQITGFDSFASLDTNRNGVLDNSDANVIVAGTDTILVLGSETLTFVDEVGMNQGDFLFA